MKCENCHTRERTVDWYSVENSIWTRLCPSCSKSFGRYYTLTRLNPDGQNLQQNDISNQLDQGTQ